MPKIVIERWCDRQHKWNPVEDGTTRCTHCGVDVAEYTEWVRLVKLKVPPEYTGNTYQGKW